MFLVFYFDDMISSSFFNRLFVQPLYCGVLLEQSLMLNRRRDDKDRDGRLGSEKVTRICFCILRIQNEYPLSLLSYLVLIFLQQKRFGFESPEMNMKNVDRGILPGRRSIKTDHTPMIYVCATMWHETTKEMIQILTSLFRYTSKSPSYTLLYCRHD